MTMTRPATTVGMGEIVFSSRPDEILVCVGLGSCIGLAAHDRLAGVGGMVHILLPGPPRPGEPTTPRFADRLVVSHVKIDRVVNLSGDVERFPLG